MPAVWGQKNNFMGMNIAGFYIEKNQLCNSIPNFG